jgi:hypothetical protein
MDKKDTPRPNWNERQLWRRAMKAESLMEKIAKEQLGMSFWNKDQKPADSLRLIRLLQWEEKYKVPAAWFVPILVKIWKKKYGEYVGKDRLGFSIATLTGDKSEQILVETIRKEFPEGEHLEIWRAKKQNAQWLTQIERRKGITWENPTIAMEQYRKKVQAERKEFQSFRERMRQRPYRNNPWM